MLKQLSADVMFFALLNALVGYIPIIVDWIKLNAFMYRSLVPKVIPSRTALSFQTWQKCHEVDLWRAGRVCPSDPGRFQMTLLPSPVGSSILSFLRQTEAAAAENAFVRIARKSIEETSAGHPWMSLCVPPEKAQMIWLATLSHALVMHPCFMINPLSSGCIEEKTRNKNYKESTVYISLTFWFVSQLPQIAHTSWKATSTSIRDAVAIPRDYVCLARNGRCPKMTFWKWW